MATVTPPHHMDKPPIPSRITQCSKCKAKIHIPLEPLYEGANRVAALYTCECVPRDTKDLDPTIRLYT